MSTKNAQSNLKHKSVLIQTLLRSYATRSIDIDDIFSEIQLSEFLVL